MSNIGDTHNPAFPTIAYAITIGHSTLDTLHSFAHFIGQLTVKTSPYPLDMSLLVLFPAGCLLLLLRGLPPPE